MASPEKEVLELLQPEVQGYLKDNFGDITAVEQPNIFASEWHVEELNVRLGGGITGGGITEVYGQESVGKTALLGGAIGMAQRLGLQTALATMEYIDEPYLRNLGVKTSELPVFHNQDTLLEDIFQFLQDFDRAFLAIDSLTSIPFGEMLTGGVMEFLLDLRESLGAKSCAVVSSHVRARTSVGVERLFIGGTKSASRRVSDLFDNRIELRATGHDMDEPTYKILINIEASKMGTPSQVFQVPAIKGLGIDVAVALLDFAVKMEVVEKIGGHYTLCEPRTYLGNGRRLAAQRLMKDENLFNAAMAALDKVTRA